MPEQPISYKDAIMKDIQEIVDDLMLCKEDFDKNMIGLGFIYNDKSNELFHEKKNIIDTTMNQIIELLYSLKIN